MPPVDELERRVREACRTIRDRTDRIWDELRDGTDKADIEVIHQAAVGILVEVDEIRILAILERSRRG